MLNCCQIISSWYLRMTSICSRDSLGCSRYSINNSEGCLSIYRSRMYNTNYWFSEKPLADAWILPFYGTCYSRSQDENGRKSPSDAWPPARSRCLHCAFAVSARSKLTRCCSVTEGRKPVQEEGQLKDLLAVLILSATTNYVAYLLHLLPTVKLAAM